MNLPDNEQLPFFTYGLFKPGEPAFMQISKHVKSYKPEEIGGYLFVRDGVPLLEPSEDKVEGFMLRFAESYAKEAYRRIADFVLTNHYKWQEFDFPNGHSQKDTSRVNVLVGIRPSEGSVELKNKSSWSAKDDAVFNEGMAIIQETIGKFGEVNLASGTLDWHGFFRLQMAYSLLWMAIERFCRLAYGLELPPERKRDYFGGDAAFVDALQETLKDERQLYNPNDPDHPIRLSPRNTMSSLRYYYTVRNNLSHKGKGEERDGLIVQLSLKELFKIFSQVLKKRVFEA